MSDHRNRARRGWAKFLNPEVLRGNPIAASIFLAAYEMLRASVIERIRSFFSHEFRDGEWIASVDYRTECRHAVVHGPRPRTHARIADRISCRRVDPDSRTPHPGRDLAR